MFLVLVSLLCFTIISAQENDYSLKNDETEKKNFISYFNQSYIELANTTLPKYTGDVKKRLKESFTDFTKEFVKEIEDNQFIYDSRFTGKANEILAELKSKNPTIPKEIKILISKQTTLNAYCLPNGTLVMHMGLFYWLNNEDQLAAIIAHEIAHKMLNHGIESQVKFIEDNFSDKSKKLVKNINRNEVRKADYAFDLFKSQLYSNAKIKQSHEYAADSLSYLLLKPTNYNLGQITSAMRLSIKYDSIKPVGLQKEIYKQVFHSEKQPFQDKWLKMEDFSQYNYDLYKEKINKDSISSHPDMELRIAKLEKNYPELLNTKTIEASDAFKKLEKLAEMNIVPSLTDLENYGYAIYLCLLNIQRENELVHHKLWLGKNFQKIYEARKNYTLNRYLDRIDPKNHSESYQQFLSFMWNLKLDELKNIAEFYDKT